MMENKKQRARDVILKTLDSAFSIAALPFALFMFDSKADYSNLMKNRLYTAALFLALGLSMICQALRRKNRAEPCRWELIRAGVYLVCVILVLALRTSDVSLPIVSLLLGGMMILNRARAIAQRPTYRSILFNGACILLVAAVAIKSGLLTIYFYTLFLLVWDLGHIISLSFSGMDMKILVKVIRRSYAADVLSGLMLLMTAFSFMFPVLEDNIPTFRDALWYCFAVVTTIGFGDYSATSDVGRLMSVLLGAYGIVVVALITSVVVNFYAEVRNQPEGDDPDAPKEI